MFTGIITHQGIVVSVEGTTDRDLWIRSELDLDAIAIGASVAHSGVCLTVVDKQGDRHRVQASSETLNRTNLCQWLPGTPVNLETSLKLESELGGHFVFGHVDAVGHVNSIESEGGSWRFRFSMPRNLAPLVAVKGSVAVDGISLTVTDIDDACFGVAVIPHTFEETTLRHRQIGDDVNLEADMLARYVRRQLDFARNTSSDV